MNNEEKHAMDAIPKDADDDLMFVTLALDDDVSLETRVVTIFELESQDYILLVPVDENEKDIENGELYVYRFYEDEDGEPTLDNITDDAEAALVEAYINDVLMEDALDPEEES